MPVSMHEAAPLHNEENWSKAQARVSEIKEAQVTTDASVSIITPDISKVCHIVAELICATCVCHSCVFRLHKCLFSLFPLMPLDSS